MELLLGILVCLCVAVCIYIEIQFRNHIISKHPEIWLALSEEKMGVKAFLSRPIAISDSARFGALSKTKDKEVKDYVSYQNSVCVLLFLLVLVSFILN